MFKQIRTFISIIILAAFMSTSIKAPAYAQETPMSMMPKPGMMINLTSAYVPVLVRGLRVHPENPFLFDFILDTGKSGLKINSPAFKAESEKLIKYFLASLTIKEDDLWVNLSPYEKDRIIPAPLGQTELGKDMLAQDYILKQLTASLIYPEKQLGKEFWNTVYVRAQQEFGTSDIPVNTFNKVWIIADKAKILERNNVGYVVGSHLKVMLEEDYLALQRHVILSEAKDLKAHKDSSALPQNDTSSLGSKVLREIVIPQLIKEVNQGKNFAPLRQMFYSMILASWYKLALKDALLNQVYSNKEKTGGVLSDDPAFKEKIFQQYLQAYKKGVFNYIKEDISVVNKQTVPRKYFSGGLEADNIPRILDREQNPSKGDDLNADGAMAVVETNMRKAGDAAMNKADEDVNTAGFLQTARTFIGNIILPKRNIGGLTQEELDRRLSLSVNVLAYQEPSANNSSSDIFVDVPLGAAVKDVVNDAIREIQSIQGVSFNPVRPGDQSHTSLAILTEFKFRIQGPNGAVSYRVATHEELEEELRRFKNAHILDGIGPLQFRIKGLHLFNNGGVVLELEPLSSDLAYVQSRLRRIAVDGSIKPFFYTTVGYLISPTSKESIQPLIDRLSVLSGQIEEKDIIVTSNEVEIANSVNRRNTELREVILLSDESNFPDRAQADAAMLVEQREAMGQTPGGIDLNAKNMAISVSGQGVQMKFDPAMVAEFRRGNFSGIVANIIRIIPIKSALAMMGLQTSP